VLGQQPVQLAGPVLLHPLLEAGHVVRGNGLLGALPGVLEVLQSNRLVYLLAADLLDLIGSAPGDEAPHGHHGGVAAHVAYIGARVALQFVADHSGVQAGGQADVLQAEL